MLGPLEGAGSIRPPLAPSQPPDGPRYHASRTSQLLFEGPVVLPLTPEQSYCIVQLDFFKRWYLLCHLAYISLCVLVGAGGLLLLQRDLSLVDAIFIATSSVCNCGLQTVDVGEWPFRTTLFRHLLLLTGGVVVTSSFQPLLRLLMLHRVRDVFVPELADTPLEAQLRTKKRAEAQRLYYTALVCAATPFVYLVVVNGAIMGLLYALNTSHLAVFDVFCMSLASFHSSIFLPMEAYVADTAVTGLVTLACALGFTAFPVVLRGFMLWEWTAVRLARRVAAPLTRWVTWCRARRRHRTAAAAEGGTAAPPPASDDASTDEDEPEVAEEADNARLLRPGRRGRAHAHPLTVFLREVDDAFHEVLTSDEPGTFHPFLFQTEETTFLGVAWCALTLMQAVPFWYEQWDGVLHGFTWPYKIYLALCQAAVVRFAAASFVPLLEYSNAHVAITIFAMFLPALPISTDRTYRKWKEMFRTSVVRLLTSRLFWLFAAMVSVLFAEEHAMRASVLHTRFDLMTRAFFEVISAYAGCGLSLTLPNASVSFVGLTGSFSRLVIAAVILGGRHRFVDLGLDLGFSTLQAQVAEVPAEVVVRPT